MGPNHRPVERALKPGIPRKHQIQREEEDFRAVAFLRHFIIFPSGRIHGGIENRAISWQREPGINLTQWRDWEQQERKAGQSAKPIRADLAGKQTLNPNSALNSLFYLVFTTFSPPQPWLQRAARSRIPLCSDFTRSTQRWMPVRDVWAQTGGCCVFCEQN